MGLLNKAAFVKNLIVAKALNKNIPLTVIFNVTDRCNLKCSYCYAGYYQRRKEELSLDQILTIIDDLSQMGCKRISLGGGEPLLRKDISKIISHIKKNDMDCTINSNGHLVCEKIDILKNTDVLCLSLDGDEKSHDIYRGKGSFKKAMEAIDCAYKNKISITTNTVLHRNNLDSIGFVLDLAKKYNFLAEFNIAISHFPGTTENTDYKNDTLKLKDALRKIIRYKEEGHNILFSKKAFASTLSWPDYKIESYFGNPPTFNYLNCSAGKFFCVIDTNGDVYACPHLIGKTETVNAANEGFKKAFANLDKHNCKACYQVYHNEFHLLFSLDLEVILNYIRNNLKVLLSRGRQRVKK